MECRDIGIDVGDESSALVGGRPRRWWLRWVLAGIAGAIVFGWAVISASRLEQDPTRVESPLIGKPAPSFLLPMLDGGTVDSVAFSGRIWVVNFWASWCVPCREEAPRLQSFYERWSSRGVGMVGIVYNDSRSAARDFREEFGLTFPQVMDPDGVAAIDFGVFGVPETFVIDEHGVVMAKLIGAVGPTTLDDVLAEVRSGRQVTDENDDYWTGPEGDR
ncbi:MAG: redoxin domain-containing protein [Lysobacter sp.]|nr:redoxin domain-containing protein [Lysobacter sp.]